MISRLHSGVGGELTVKNNFLIPKFEKRQNPKLILMFYILVLAGIPSGADM